MTSRHIEYAIAVASFIAAVVFAFLALAIGEDHSVSASNCSVIAQFLLLTASIFGIDYKFSYNAKRTQFDSTSRASQQKPAEHKKEP